MREFFRGWRRKVGVVTLVMACAFAASWIRSQLISDTFVIPDWRSESQITISDGQVSWSRLIPCRPAGWLWISNDLTTEWLPVEPWQHKACGGFAFGSELVGTWSGFTSRDETTNGEFHLKFWAIPHWSIATFLTLLSAYLLIIKPRPATTKQTTEPAPTTGN